MNGLLENIHSPVALVDTPETPAFQPGSGVEPSHVVPTIGNPALNHLIELLGRDVVFLPIASMEKGPKEKGWQQFTVAKMQEQDYLAKFTGNIGVLLGRNSGHLISIDVDSDAGLESFLQLNPVLRTTLISKGNRGGNVWIRAKGAYPDLTMLKTADGEDWGEVRSNGGQTVIYGTHREGPQYQFVNEAKPLEVDFATIVWPEDLVLPWVKTETPTLFEKEGDPVIIDDKGNIAINDMVIAKMFALERPTVFEAAEQEFYQYEYTTGLWVKRTAHEIKSQFSDDLQRMADELGDRRILVKRKNNLLNSLVELLKVATLKSGVFQRRGHLIHCKNGVLDLQTGGLREFDPLDYSRNCCPIIYKAEAGCPRFLNELLYPALKKEDISLFQRFGGAALMGRNPSQRFVFITGSSGQGKSVAMKVLIFLIGADNVAELRTEHLASRFELYNLVGRQLLTGVDVPSDFFGCKGASIIKKLVGGDFFQAEKKGGAHVKLEGNYNLLVTSNSGIKIHLDNDADAWNRRLLVIPFNGAKPALPIDHFAEKLIDEEGSGILNFFVEGAIQHLQEIKETGDYRLTPSQKLRIHNALLESDSVRTFLETRVIPFPGGIVSKPELIAKYIAFCKMNGWTPDSPYQVGGALSSLMQELFHLSLSHDIPSDSGSQRGYRGVCIRSEEVIS